MSASCDVAGCGRKMLARGWCNGHYKRVQAYGHPMADVPLMYKPLAAERDDVVQRLLVRSESTDTGCIQWSGAVGPDGYGIVHWAGQQWKAHRAMWTARIGPLPVDGDMTIDHLCGNRRCVNVDHMEVVTRAENSRRGGGLLVATTKRAAMASCMRGHAFTDANTTVRANGARTCKECARLRYRARRAA